MLILGLVKVRNAPQGSDRSSQGNSPSTGAKKMGKTEDMGFSVFGKHFTEKHIYFHTYFKAKVF